MALYSGAGSMQPERVMRMRRRASVLLCAILAVTAGPLNAGAQEESTWEVQELEVPAGGCGKVRLGSGLEEGASFTVLPLPRPVRPCLGINSMYSVFF